MNKTISFPHLGSYHIPIKYILKKITKCKVIVPPINNKETITLGSKYSPQDVCMPFKYNLGNYINALKLGANILVQAGGGCRYGYYAELQEQILKDLGYQFTFINLIKNNHVSILNTYKFAKKLNKKLNIVSYTYYLLQGFIMIYIMDKQQKYLRENMGKAKNPKLFEITEKEFQESLSIDHLNIIKILKIYKKYQQKYKTIELKEEDNIKILLVGELYSLIDNNASNNLERALINQGIKIYRYTDLTYLLIKKNFMKKIILHKGKKYIKYTLGADGAESVAYAKEHAEKGIDGIIHIKSYSCVPEINAMPILSQISEDYNTPILYLSFDGENNISNIDTKIEAFIDMIKSKKNKKKI